MQKVASTGADIFATDAHGPRSRLLAGASRTELDPGQDANDRQQQPRGERDMHSEAEDS